MNRQMLIRQMAERQQISKAQAKVQLQHILASLTQALSEGEKVYLPQFGTFELRYHIPRNGRNPQTGEPLEIAGSNQPSFKASPSLKQALQPE